MVFFQLSGMRPFFSYDAPEVSDSGAYSEKSDVYSFGIVMLELLTGRKPFDRYACELITIVL